MSSSAKVSLTFYVFWQKWCRNEVISTCMITRAPQRWMNYINHSFKGAAHLHFTESVYVDALSVNKVKPQHFTLILIKPKQVDA